MKRPSIKLLALAGVAAIAAIGFRPLVSRQRADASPEPAIQESELPPMGQQEADGKFGFTVRTRPASDVFDDIQRAGFPAGLSGIDTFVDYNRLRVGGAPEAVQAMRRLIARYDTVSTSGKVVFHIRLRELIATGPDLAGVGLKLEDFSITPDQEAKRAAAATLERALEQGALKPVNDEMIDVEDGKEVTRTGRRGVTYRDPTFWPSRSIPRALDTTLVFTPRLTEPGKIEFTVQRDVREVRSVLPFPPRGFTGQSGWSWSGDNQTILLSSLQEERRATPIPSGGYHTEGAAHIWLATTRIENPAGGGNRASPDTITSDHMAASICGMVAPAASWRAIGLDPDDPTPRMAPGHLGFLRGAEGARDDGPMLDATVWPGYETPLMSSTLAGPESGVFSVLKFRARRISGEKAEMWVDLDETPAPGANPPRDALVRARYHGTVSDGGPPTLFLCGHKAPGGKDLRRLTFVVFTLNM